MTIAQHVRDVIPAFDGLRTSNRRGRAEGRGEERGVGRSSQCQAEKGSLLGNSGSQQEGICPRSQAREGNVCHTHIHAHAHTYTHMHLFCFNAGKVICPDTAQPAPFVNATVLRQTATETPQLYFLRGLVTLKLVNSGSPWSLMTQHPFPPSGKSLLHSFGNPPPQFVMVGCWVHGGHTHQD